jgi:hypothetical protein
LAETFPGFAARPLKKSGRKDWQLFKRGLCKFKNVFTNRKNTMKVLKKIEQTLTVFTGC